MKKITLLLIMYLLFSSHDMFLKMDTHYLLPNTPANILLFNGTFERSDNVITRDRMIDVSLVGNGERITVDTTSWIEQDKTTILNFTSGESGTWVAGVSTLPRNIELEAKSFNDYLKHDGVLDMLEKRKQDNTLDNNAIEKYSKHVKTIFQVGNKRSEDWNTILGYPIEFIPLKNPYHTKKGEELKVQLLWKGQPLPNQLVYVGSGMQHDHSHDTASTISEDDHHHNATQLRTDKDGIVTVKLKNGGQWYLRTIHMEVSEEPGLTHESNWATLTFQVGEKPTHTEESHHHGDGVFHSHEDGHSHRTPPYVYVLGGIALLAGLFWFFRFSQSK